MKQRLQGGGEVLEEIARDGGDHAYPQADGDDVEVVAVAVVVGPRQDADAGGQHHAEHDDASTAEHEGGNGGDQHRHLGNEAEGEQDPPRHDADPAARHPGHAHQPDVLGKRGVGEAVEDAADDGAYAIHPQPAHYVAATGRVTDDVTESQKHPHRLDEGDKHDHRQSGDGDRVEGGPAKGEWHYGSKPGRVIEAVQAHLAHGDGHPEAKQDPEQYRDVAEKSLGEAGHQQDEGEHQKAGADVAQAAVLGIALAPGHPVDPYLHDADPDRGDDHPGHHGGEKRHQAADEGNQQGGEDPGGYGGAEDAG